MRRNLIVMFMTALLFSFASRSFAGDGTQLIVDPNGGGDAAPEFALEDFATGKEIALGEYLGKKVVMVEFWATWCDICKEEIPDLVKVQNEWKDKKFQILAITLSPGDEGDRKKIQKQVDKNAINYPILLDTKYKVATELYKLKGPIPLKLVIDCSGKLVQEYVGQIPPGDDFKFMLEALTTSPACK